MALETDVNDSRIGRSTLDRVRDIRAFIEGMIAEVGEHPECELKITWGRNTPYLKAEFIKDFQATANSAIPQTSAKYIVVGADQTSRTITGCNPADFDEASIRQLLESYLDPVPDFEVLALRSSTGVDFVVVSIPHQADRRPFIAKATIRDNKNKVHLEEGQIWFKPGGESTGSTGKRLVRNRTELLELIDVEPRVRSAVAARLENLVPQIRLEERTRLQGHTNHSIPVLSSTDEEFESYVEQFLATSNETLLNIVVERLREKTVSLWEAFAGGSEPLTGEKIREIKEAEFLPAAHRLALLGLLLIKFSAPVGWFNRIAALLEEMFNVSQPLGRAVSHEVREQRVASLDELANHNVPAFESLIAAYMLGGYALRRNFNTAYPATFFPRVTGVWGKRFYLFWPIDDWNPNRQRDLLVLDRYGRGDRVEAIVGGKESLKKAVLQFDCLIDWHSFMMSGHTGERETVDYLKTSYPGVSSTFTPNYTHESLRNVMPLIERLWSALHTVRDENHLLLDAGLAKAFEGIEVERREKLLTRFCVEAERQNGEWRWSTHRMPVDVQWPQEIVEVAKKLQTTSNG